MLTFGERSGSGLTPDRLSQILQLFVCECRISKMMLCGYIPFCYDPHYMDRNTKLTSYSQWRTLLSALMLLCICLPLLTSCESQKIIVNNLDEREANEIIVYLSTRGINATKSPAPAAGGGGGSKIPLYDINVNSDVALEAMSYLNQAGLPRRRSQNLLNLFTGAGLVPSEMEQKIRYEAGLAEQIASTIRKMDGVLDAEVQLSFPQEDPLNPQEKKGVITASVFVKHNGVLDDPNSHLISKIKRFVSASVTGLLTDNVTVVGEKTRYSDLPLGAPGTGIEEEKQYVSIWSLIIAKESVTRFRIIFFTFTFLLLVILSLMIWMTWKISPLLKGKGGFKELFKLKPLQHDTTEKPAETKEGESAEEKAKQEQVQADKDVDQT